MNETPEIVCDWNWGKYLVFLSIKNPKNLPIDLIQKLYDVSFHQICTENVYIFILEESLVCSFLYLQLTDVAKVNFHEVVVDFNYQD